MAADGKSDLIGDEATVELTLNKENNTEEDDSNKLNVETVVKDLGNVSPSEMKQIIEGAEVIVESDIVEGDVTHEVVTEQSIIADDNNINDIDSKSDVVEVITTTVTNDNDSSIIETVVDNVVEVGSSVVDDTSTTVDSNTVQFNDSDSTVNGVNELSDATATAAAVTESVPMMADVTVSNSDEQSSQENIVENNEVEREPQPEPDSSRLVYIFHF